MATTYYKRFRMELDFRRVSLPDAVLPEGYDWVPWHASLRQVHARVKHESFRGEIDARIFASLNDLPGCTRLMNEISSDGGFRPRCTWIVRFLGDDFRAPTACGTIQGVMRSRRLGAIQNVGVVAEHRGLGLGRALLLQSLAGFRDARAQRVTLEVTAANRPAVEMYRAAGFQLMRTSYREVQTAGEVCRG